MDKLGKIIFVSVTLIMLYALTLLAFSFGGASVGERNAIKSSEKYIERNFPDLNYELNNLNHKFGEGIYEAEYISKKSKDTKFVIYVDNKGKVIGDTYDDILLNTKERVNKEVSKKVDEILRENLSYDFKNIDVKYVEENYDIYLDMEIMEDNLPKDINIIMEVFSDETTDEYVYKLVEDINRKIQDNGFNVYYFDLKLIPTVEKGSEKDFYEGEIVYKDIPKSIIEIQDPVNIIKNYKIS